jgi:hypothetical protein
LPPAVVPLLASSSGKFRTYTGTKLGTEQGALQTGQTLRDSLMLNPNDATGNPSDCRSEAIIPGSSHLKRQGQQYKWPHCVTTGSVTASRQMLQLNLASPGGEEDDEENAPTCEDSCAMFLGCCNFEIR